jgi:alpha-amylase/alpha-mannosidase (GH57 family)
MHQPQYTDPRTGIAMLPWVRLHGVRAYLDVARVLADYPDVHLTVNFVPSLVEQLEAIAAGAEDAWVRTSKKPVAEWTPDDRFFLLERLFSIHWGHGVDPRPRYKELLDKRGRDSGPAQLRSRAYEFSGRELRDLTVLFHLAWLGFAAREGDAEVAALEAKGRDYDEQDLALVLEKQRLACARVLPAYRALAERGQVELSASPYYHPIVPMLIDTEHARRAQPSLPLPERYAWAEDAREQIKRGAASHQRTFGSAPLGMWPPEGSVSPEAVAAYADAGVRWLATCEGNLWRSLDKQGRAHTRSDLYRAYKSGETYLLFRDRELSDRIGFAYAHGDSVAGAHDLVERSAAAAAQAQNDAAPALVPIFLDGENPWEAYPGSGEPFLRALCQKLSADPRLRARTIAEHLQLAAPAAPELPALHSGSWIDSDFHIWIGDPVKNRAWDLLGQVRRRIELAGRRGLAADKLAVARERMFAAEGSDWFWWFGDPFSSAEDALFDELFRAHLEGALRAIGEPIPDALLRPVARTPELPSTGSFDAPWALISPPVGKASSTSFYAWHGAGTFVPPRGAAMADNPIIERLRFGFDRAHLFLRVELAPARAEEATQAVLEIELSVLPEPRRLRLRVAGSQSTMSADHGNGFFDVGPCGTAAVVGTQSQRPAFELSVPLLRLSAAPGARLSLSLKLLERDVPLARCPADGALELSVPDPSFEAKNWSV